MEKELFAKLISRKREVLLHFEKVLSSPLGKAEYFLSPLNKGEDYAIDIALFEPSEDYPYFVASTVGLSCYQFNKMYARCELMLALPQNYKFDASKEDSTWPLELLRRLAYLLLYAKKVPALSQIYEIFDKDELKATNQNCGILVAPDMFDGSMFEEKIDDTYTRFYQLVPLSSTQVKKALDVGVQAFIEFDLHDAEGPDTVVNWKPKTNKKIEEIISHNEGNLKSKTKK